MLKYLARVEQMSFMGVRNVNTKASMFEIFEGTLKTGTNLSQRKESKETVRRPK